MSKQPFDSFLPSGAVDSPDKLFGRSSSMISPRSVPRTVPDYISPHNSGSGSPSTFLTSQSPSQKPPISPPKTRSGSAEDSAAALVEDWRAYTQKLRSQNEGERAHMAADRARMDEVMAEERALWDKERKWLYTRVAELEMELEKAKGSIPHAISHRSQPTSFSPLSNPVSTGSAESASKKIVPQESGRDADGSPFYAPAPRNPSRTFDPSETSEMRVDSITAPRESAIRVTSKELTSSDFGVQSPSAHDLDTIIESPAESIDISQIQPELEGVSIKASAVSPTFAAKVLSPRRSPPKLSPDVVPPGRDVTNMARTDSKDSKGKKTLEVVSQPENRRLTMHAGHTPNHSISKFSFLGGDAESGSATPTQEHHEVQHRPSVAPGYVEPEAETHDEEHNGDQEMSGPLGLTNDAPADNEFLARLTEKLEEARRSVNVSPSNESASSREVTLPLSRQLSREQEEDEEEKDEGPRLRLKPSFNFGRPLGSI